ncbi:MAG: ATPase, T2SS/T4P/T4SS family [Pirellulaceae bacterium]
MRYAIRGRINMIVSGGTGSGKSTFLGALAEAIFRLRENVTIEEVHSSHFHHKVAVGTRLTWSDSPW